MVSKKDPNSTWSFLFQWHVLIVHSPGPHPFDFFGIGIECLQMFPKFHLKFIKVSDQWVFSPQYTTFIPVSRSYNPFPNHWSSFWHPSTQKKTAENFGTSKLSSGDFKLLIFWNSPLSWDFSVRFWSVRWRCATTVANPGALWVFTFYYPPGN